MVLGKVNAKDGQRKMGNDGVMEELVKKVTKALNIQNKTYSAADIGVCVRKEIASLVRQGNVVDVRWCIYDVLHSVTSSTQWMVASPMVMWCNF